MMIWTKSSYENIFQDTAMPYDYVERKLDLVMARNERESFQILVRSEDSFTIRSVTFGDLVCGLDRIFASEISYGFVEYVFTPDNSVGVAKESLVREAPAWYPDPISNDRSIKVPARTTQPVWITVYVPPEAAPGLYQGCATVHTSQGDHSVPFRVEVCDVTIPATNEAALIYSHHQQMLSNFWMDASSDSVYNTYGYERWSEGWWEVIRNIAELMRAHRHNALYVNLHQLLLDGGSKVDENGIYTFNWSKLDEYVDFFLDAGVIRWVNCMHLTSVEMKEYYFMVCILKADAQGNMMLVEEPCESQAAENWLRQLLPALQAHVEERGWLDFWELHVGDEPRNDVQRAQYMQLLKQTREYAPKMLVCDAVCSLDGAKWLAEYGVDIIVAVEDVYDENRELFEEMRKKGTRIFLYNCCVPFGTYLNRFVDRPIWEMRTLGWLLYSWDIDCYYHWGYSFWNTWTHKEPITIAEEPSKGDHYTIYPDPHSNKVRSSMRYEANRDAAEDFELLTILGRRDPEYAKELVARIARDSHTEYTKDIPLMIETRKELVRAAAGQDCRKQKEKGK